MMMEGAVLLDVSAVAERLHVSPRKVWRMRDSGWLPAPIILGRLIRWRSEDIVAWVVAGCPDCRSSGWSPRTG